MLGFPGDPWLTLTQAAVYTQFSADTLKREIDRGRLRVSRVGSATHPAYRFRRSWLDAWLESYVERIDGHDGSAPGGGLPLMSVVDASSTLVMLQVLSWLLLIALALFGAASFAAYSLDVESVHAVLLRLGCPATCSLIITFEGILGNGLPVTDPSRVFVSYAWADEQAAATLEQLALDEIELRVGDELAAIALRAAA